MKNFSDNNKERLNLQSNKGNIPINDNLLNRYKHYNDMLEKEQQSFKTPNITLTKNVKDINNIELYNLSFQDVFKLARGIFNKYNSKNTFINDGNIITVSNADIKESVDKIFSSQKQRGLLKEHFLVFKNLGEVIESATLSNQTFDNKKRNNIWHYYLNGLNIDGQLYILEFDVTSREDGTNHYRVQRLEKIKTKADVTAGSTTWGSTIPTLVTSASNNTIAQKQ